MLTALIMAGGKGTRFWPISTENKPKQFLNLIDDKTMLQATIERLEDLINIDHIFVCTGVQYIGIIKEQLPNLPEKNIIIEPTGKNTAPCILLSLLYIKQIYMDANVVVLPSDHKINNKKEFLKILSVANKFVDDTFESIVTIGIEPNRPETGYGYINFSDNIEKIDNYQIKKVRCFVEKPNLNIAKEYLDKGTYLWNAGMFVFNCKFMIEEFKRLSNQMYQILSTLPAIEDENYMEVLEKKYSLCESISIDYAIMEKSKHIFVIPGDFGWDDIGSWKALERYIKKDENNNIFKGKVNNFNSKNNIAYSKKKEIILLDINELFVIEADDKIVVGKKESISKVYELRDNK